MTKEFKLSEEINKLKKQYLKGHSRNNIFTNLEKIHKEFIKKLKEKARKYAGVNQMIIEINKLAGEKLI